MPYDIVKHGKQFCVRNTDTDEIKPGRCHDTKEKAKAQMGLLYGVEKGWKPTGRKSTVVDKKSA